MWGSFGLKDCKILGFPYVGLKEFLDAYYYLFNTDSACSVADKHPPRTNEYLKYFYTSSYGQIRGNAIVVKASDSTEPPKPLGQCNLKSIPKEFFELPGHRDHLLRYINGL